MNDHPYTIRKFIFQNFPFMAALGLGIIQLYLVSQLAPISQAISNLDLRVRAVETDQGTISGTLVYIQGQITTLVGDVGEMKGMLKTHLKE